MNAPGSDNRAYTDRMIGQLIETSVMTAECLSLLHEQIETLRFRLHVVTVMCWLVLIVALVTS